MAIVPGTSETRPKKPNLAPREYHVGDKLQIKLHDGRSVDATIRAIVDDGDKVQVDFGHQQTTLIIS